MKKTLLALAFLSLLSLPVQAKADTISLHYSTSGPVLAFPVRQPAYVVRPYCPPRVVVYQPRGHHHPFHHPRFAEYRAPYGYVYRYR